MGQVKQACYKLGFVLNVQGGEKERLHGGKIGQALILLETADLRFAVPDRDGEFELGEALAAAQKFEQVTEGVETGGVGGFGGH